MRKREWVVLGCLRAVPTPRVPSPTRQLRTRARSGDPPLCIPGVTYVCTCVHLTKVEFLLLCILRVTVWIKQKWDHPWVHTMCLCACGTIWNYSGDPPCVSAHIMSVLVSMYILIILLHSIPTYMVTTWCRFGSQNMDIPNICHFFYTDKIFGE